MNDRSTQVGIRLAGHDRACASFPMSNACFAYSLSRAMYGALCQEVPFHGKGP